MKRTDDDGKFLRETCGVRLRGAGGNIVVVTASGKQLAHNVEANDTQPGVRWASAELRRALDEWARLPQSDREPSARRSVQESVSDAAKAPPGPPQRGLILKEYYRALAEEPAGELRHVALKDFVHADQLSQYRDPGDKRYFSEAAPDFVWLTEEEWKTLIPANLNPGADVAVPANITERIFRFHLAPAVTFGESMGWARKQIRGGDLREIVEQASPSMIRLRVEGFARLGVDYETAVGASVSGRVGTGYEPHILGYIEYDPREGRIDRFDMIGLGDLFGTPGSGSGVFYRPGRTPLGVAFELVTARSPTADRRVPPRGAEFSDYFGEVSRP